MAAKHCSLPQLLTMLLVIVLLFFANACNLISRLPSPVFNSIQDSEIFHSTEVFRLNYEEMESKFKIFIYPESDTDAYYYTQRKLTGKYASEGFFFQNIKESKFRTDDPEMADMFFIPISCYAMHKRGMSYEDMARAVQSYLESLIQKYPYWNRSLGSDHFIVSCHEKGWKATEGVPLSMRSIRILCSPTYDARYVPHKDFALPQIMQPFSLPPGGNDLQNRTRLGFWAGERNSKIKDTLISEWKGDLDLDVWSSKTKMDDRYMLYEENFLRSKFCICTRGLQASSVRIAESIHYGCIPVIMSNYLDLPFSDILDWEKFSIVLKEDDAYTLKDTLEETSNAEFIAMHKNVVKVQKHFQWHSPPEKFDAFHMVMYELWLRHHRATKY